MSSENNVTPIKPPAGPRAPRRPRKPERVFLKLISEVEGEEFTTLDAVNGLRGVCQALDLAAVDSSCQDIDHVGDLAMAAKILSQIVGGRVEEVS
jgi:hypothetical protein